MLNEAHLSRIQQDKEFRFILDDIAEYKASNDRDVVSLNEKQRIAQRKKDEDKRLARLNERQKLLGKPAFEKLAVFFTSLLMNFNDYLNVRLCVCLDAGLRLRVKKRKRKTIFRVLRNITPWGSLFN